MSDESDDSIVQVAPIKKVKKKPLAGSTDDNSEDGSSKKSTKTMIQEALLTLKTRKGVSYYAIKKYIADNYNVDIDKVKHIIKKQLKSGVEQGTILQTKGTGASGSFKLVQGKEQKPKPVKKTHSPDVSGTLVEKVTDKRKKPADEDKKSASKTKKTADGSKKTTDVKKKSTVKMKKSADKMKKSADKIKSNEKVDDSKVKSNSKESPKATKIKRIKADTEEIITKKQKPGMSKDVKTPSKKRVLLMKRKSIGSIIKPPKMKPKAK